MTTLNIILWGFIIARCQEHSKLHTDQEEWENSVRYKIAVITSKDGELIYWTKRTKYGITLGSFGYDKLLQAPKSFQEKPRGCYQIWYCNDHKFAYMVEAVDQKYCPN